MTLAVGQWDEWRTQYPAMSLQEHQDYYDAVYREFPSQRHYDLGALLDWVDDQGIETVVELGGWNGELAAAALHLRPQLKRWTNFEICPKAAAASVSADPRYRVEVADQWFWELDDLPEADCFVASHTIEHLSLDHWDRLARRLDYPLLFLDAPLHPEVPTAWAGFTGTHILPLSWEHVTAGLHGLGYDLAWTHWKYMVHCYSRR